MGPGHERGEKESSIPSRQQLTSIGRGTEHPPLSATPTLHSGLQSSGLPQGGYAFAWWEILRDTVGPNVEWPGTDGKAVARTNTDNLTCPVPVR